MSKLEIEAVRIFISDMRHAKKIKSSIIRIAKEEPEKILNALGCLHEEDQKYLRWLKAMAESNISGM